ncbi:PEP-CTERM sorting domain-containing protein [Alteromonas sp. ASW11-36]|uniref:PEP-CTERM sorting domain-containing protein n=1 Tax=Alteromonas arenosi TaxID=3055817 RepID=A0ABT7SUL4_9ALTE|nr:PEP-CTERM sorting domain-containing protein [Alteromonas sp. ASW11-36]MDM7859886.1 PEP-CTERM sorting domain-containing protein [Alteromonas sp. ASW11-36]
MKYLIAGLLLLLSASANANLIESENYTNDSNNNYWTNLDLGLDVLRLDWVDTLGSDSQVDLAGYQQFVADSKGAWRFATWAEFVSLYNWFDTDPTTNGWSIAQNVGGNLFFELNGYGPDHTDQYGFDHEGYTYWQFGTLNADEELEFVWFADFGDQDERVVCVEWSVLCMHSYFPDVGSPMWTAANAIGMASINVAPVLVRDFVGSFSARIANVSEPSIMWMLLTGMIFLGYRRAKSAV